MEPNRWVAHLFELHGCFSRGATADEAIKSAPDAITDYLIWRDGYKSDKPIVPNDLIVSEQVGYFDHGAYYSNTFFESDRLPLTNEDIDQISIILSYSRNDLDNLIQTIPHEYLDRKISSERFESINGILTHIAKAEWWYFDSMKLGLAYNELSGEPKADLVLTREKSLAVMPRLVGRTDVVMRGEENWSARKIMRRTIWHEIVHTRHIRRRLNEMSES